MSVGLGQNAGASPSSADGKSIRETIFATNSFSDGQHVYKNGSTWALGRADSAATCQGLWYVENATPGSFDIVRGRVTVPSGLGLSPGSYYVDAATAGLFTATAPTNAAHFVVPCLVVEAGNVGTFWPPAFPSSNALLTVADLSSGAEPAGRVPKTDGAGGVAWGDDNAGSGGGVLSVLLTALDVASNMPSAVQFIGGSTGYRKGAQVDATNFTQARLLCTRDASTAATGSRMALRYVASGATTYMTAANYAAAGTSEIELNLESTSTTLATAWINLAAGAKADCYFAPITYGGDGVADPSVGNVYVQFK